jgi:hypothetical protein
MPSVKAETAHSSLVASEAILPLWIPSTISG